MPTTLTKPESAPRDLAAELRTVEQAITRLQARYTALPALIAGAVADPERLLALQRENDEAPAHIRALRVQRLSLQIEQAEARSPAADTDWRAACAEAERLRGALQAAQEAYNLAVNAVAGQQYTRTDLSRSIAQWRRERAELLADPAGQQHAARADPAGDVAPRATRQWGRRGQPRYRQERGAVWRAGARGGRGGADLSELPLPERRAAGG